LRKKQTILFLAANPIETAPLALDREARAIQKELESAGFRNRFELVTRWAVERAPDRGYFWSPEDGCLSG
jgi:hypothetical protein